jgi:hypothetical protein
MIVDYHLIFADQGKQTSVFCSHLQQTNRSLPIRFFVCSKQMEVAFSVSFFFYFCNTRNMETWRHGDGGMETWRHTYEHGNINMEIHVWRHSDMDICIYRQYQTEMETHAFFQNLSTIYSFAIGSLSFVRLFMKKQTQVIRFQLE